MKLKVGQAAPDFILPDQDGLDHTLSAYVGKWVLVYFYPRDDTPGCTTEACAIRDEWSKFKRNNMVVLGVSKDPVGKHRKFADKHQLPFTLLSDGEAELIKAYGAWGRKKFMGREFEGILRQSVLIDPKGVVAKVYNKVKPAGHAAEVLKDRKSLAKA